MKLISLALLLLAFHLETAVTLAQGGLSFFQTPSGNIHCLYDPDAGGSLRCDLLRFTGKRLPQPKDCGLDWGDSFYLESHGKSSGVCHGDTLQMANNPKLAYGTTWTRGGIVCTSKPTGLRCVNADKHGFELSKAAAKLF